MKIFFIGQKGIPSISGGVEKHVEDLAPCLVKQGHEVFVYTRFNYTSRKLKEYKGVKLIGLPTLPTKHGDAITHTFLVCLHLFFQRKVDVVHFHSIGPSFWIWLARILKPKTLIVATFHSRCYHHRKWGRLARLSLKTGERMCVRYADKLVVVSRILKEYVKETYNREAYYIPNGVLTPSVLDVDGIRAEWGLEGKDYFLSVSRLVRHKGIHHLIRAFKELETDKKLIIAGGGANTDDYVQELKELAQEDDRIMLVGSQSGKLLGELYSNAFAFVQASEAEGLSIALLESMSYGLPVIASNIKENREALDDGGLFFENKDHRNLKDKMEYALKDQEALKRSGDKNKTRATTHYNWDNIVNDLEQVYSGKF